MSNMVIYTDHNGLTVESISKGLPDHYYRVSMGRFSIDIYFQQGPISECGLTGLTNEALLKIMIDRTEYLNSLQYCTENDTALVNMRRAFDAFQERTRKRQAMNIEGTQEAHERPMVNQPRIVCAACMVKDTDIVVTGARHFDMQMHQQINLLVDAGKIDKHSDVDWVEGFVDQFNKFYTREEAWAIAAKQGQIIRRCQGDSECLYSENLY